MDHKHPSPGHFYNVLLNIMAGKGATSNINYYQVLLLKEVLQYIILLSFESNVLFQVISDIIPETLDLSGSRES